MDIGFEMGMNSNQRVYIGGVTSSSNFPLTIDAYQSSFGGVLDACYAKFDSLGINLLYSTYVGGSDNEDLDDIDVWGSNKVYLTGVTASSDYPVTPASAYQTSLNGGVDDPFLTYFQGNVLEGSTFFGGSSFYEFAQGIHAAPGKAYVTGYTKSTDFPVVLPEQSANAGIRDAFLSVFYVDFTCNHDYDDTYIDGHTFASNTTLSGNYIFGGTITVPAGVTLTLQASDIIVATCGKILVEQDGSLNVDNTSLGSCVQWQGIENYGTTQVYNNSQISEASIGVFSQDGQTLEVQSSTFTNNMHHVMVVNSNTYHVTNTSIQGNTFDPVA